MPNAGEVRYVRPHETDAARGARTMKAPDPNLAAQARAAVQAGLGTGASALAPKAEQTAPGETPQAPVTVDPATQAQEPEQSQQPTVAQEQQLQQPQPQQQQAAPAATQPQQQQGQPPAPVQAQAQQQGPAAAQQTQPPAPVTPAGGAAPTTGG
jgi:hypothetical protein